MNRLLQKNLLLNKKNIIVGIFLSFFFAAINLDGNQYYSVSLMMCPALLFNAVVGKMCYMEDPPATQQFLLSLPISKRQIIFEKNILSYLCIITGLLIANISNIFINLLRSGEIQFQVNINIMMAIILIIYNTVYILLNYRFDYSKTRFTPYILLLLMFFLFKFGNNAVDVISLRKPILLVGVMAMVILLNYLILNAVTITKTKLAK